LSVSCLSQLAASLPRPANGRANVLLLLGGRHDSGTRRSSRAVRCSGRSSFQLFLNELGACQAVAKSWLAYRPTT